MTFENPIWLSLTPLLAIAAAGLVALGLRQRRHLLARFAASRLLDQLTEKAGLQRTLIKAGLVIAAATAIGLALARPQYGVEWSQQKARGLDIVFALDSSKSMLATDLRPTRLDRAKLAVLDLIDRLESDRIGLVAFAGQAFLQTPPTLDYAAFRESLEATDPSVLSRGGSDLGRALGEAAEAFPSENNVKVVVLLTDGEDLRGEAIPAARKAAEEGIQVFAIGIGTPEGEYLRVRNEQGEEVFVRDDAGQPVRTQLDEATLIEIANLTGGRYTRLGASALDQLYDSVLATLPRKERASELQEVRIERFQWMIGAALLCLTAEMLIRRRGGNRGTSGLLCLMLLTPCGPHTAEAKSPLKPEPPQTFNLSALPLATAAATPSEDGVGDLDQLAFKAMQAGDYATALEQYRESIRQSDHRGQERDALYNMGHAQHQIARKSYRQGNLNEALREIKEAEAFFQSANEIDPDDPALTDDLEAIARVRQRIEKLAKQEQKQPSNEPNQESPKTEDSSEENESQKNQKQSEGNNGKPQAGGQSQKGQSKEGQSKEDQENQQNASSSGDQPAPEAHAGDPRDQEDGDGEADNPSPGSGDATEREASEPERNQPGGDDPQTNRPTTGQAEAESDRARDDTERQTAPGTTPVPEVPDSEDTDGAAAARASEQADGMTIEEAQDLLDSLRGREEILPFTEPVPNGGRPLQDW